MSKLLQSKKWPPTTIGSDEIAYTRHGMTQMQKRSISPIIISWLRLFGSTMRRHGADVWYFDKRAKKELKKLLGKKIYGRIKDQLDIYAVVSADNILITAAHRLRRLKA